jgi:hypothetical protein
MMIVTTARYPIAMASARAVYPLVRTSTVTIPSTSGPTPTLIRFLRRQYMRQDVCLLENVRNLA